MDTNTEREIHSYLEMREHYRDILDHEVRRGSDESLDEVLMRYATKHSDAGDPVGVFEALERLYEPIDSLSRAQLFVRAYEVRIGFLRETCQAYSQAIDKEVAGIHYIDSYNQHLNDLRGSERQMKIWQDNVEFHRKQAAA